MPTQNRVVCMHMHTLGIRYVQFFSVTILKRKGSRVTINVCTQLGPGANMGQLYPYIRILCELTGKNECVFTLLPSEYRSRVNVP